MWSNERVGILEDLTGKTVNEMLANYAEYHLECDKCPLFDKCKNTVITCGILWRQFLEGKYEK